MFPTVNVYYIIITLYYLYAKIVLLHLRMIETGIYKGNDHLKANHGILANDGALANQVISDRTSVTHGIHRTKTITSSQIVKSVTHNFHSGQYLVLYEDGSLDAFLKYGRLKNGNLWKLQKLGKFDGIVYASKSQMYIAWTKEGNIKVMKPCVLLSQKIP